MTQSLNRSIPHFVFSLCLRSPCSVLGFLIRFRYPPATKSVHSQAKHTHAVRTGFHGNEVSAIYPSNFSCQTLRAEGGNLCVTSPGPNSSDLSLIVLFFCHS